MAVRIEAGTDSRLHLTGDIEASLDVPNRARAEGFSLAFSDGTLVRASYPEGTSGCRFTVMTEGAALVRIARRDSCDVLDLDWTFDWITLASGTETLRPRAAADDDGVLQLAFYMVVEEPA